MLPSAIGKSPRTTDVLPDPSEAGAHAQPAVGKTTRVQLLADDRTTSPANPHGAPYEVPQKPGSPDFAPNGQYNHKPHESGRPTVEIGHQKEFKLIRNAKLFSLASNGKTGKQVGEFVAGTTVFVDDVHKRTLDGVHGDCVLVFARGRGTGWMQVDAIESSTKAQRAIEGQADRSYDQLAPGIAPIDPKNPTHPSDPKVPKATRYRFRPTSDKLERPDDHDDTSHILKNQRGTNNVMRDYLLRQVPDGTDKSGKARTRSYYNVCLNLPSAGVPAVADDVVPPNTYFFVPSGPQFIKEVPLYHTAGQGGREDKAETWVYGFIAKVDHAGTPTPDTSRRGWVPLRDLAHA